MLSRFSRISERKVAGSFPSSLQGAFQRLPPYHRLGYSTISSRQYILHSRGTRCLSTALDKDSPLSGTNTAYLEEMYYQWQTDPSSVNKSWDLFFRTGDYTPPPRLVGDYTPRDSLTTSKAFSTPTLPSPGAPITDAHLSKLVKLVRAYQVIGFKYSNLDPLGLTKPESDPPALKLSTYGITEKDLEASVDLSVNISPVHGFLRSDRGRVKIGDIVERLRAVYVGSVGYEYMHIPESEKCNFIREHIENTKPQVYKKEDKLKILERLMWADHFEAFLARKFSSAKRFGLEGAESCIPGMKTIIHAGSALGVDSIVIGMPHRGRLNVLANVIRKPLEAVLAGFRHDIETPEGYGSGDVKYHLGMSLDRTAGPDNRPIHLTLLANPSHLEAVNPVVMGKAFAKQQYKGDKTQDKVISVLLHGDAAFAAQGVVYESFSMSRLPNYSVGGTIHIVVNNQVGFTTDPPKSGICTDIAKSVNAPIFHVNADDPEAVAHVCELAVQYRMKFKGDVVIDLVCYRKYGHNETDEPKFTQPLMYDAIKKHPGVLNIYTERLTSEGSVSKEEIQKMSKFINGVLEEGFEKSKTYKDYKAADWLDQGWKGYKSSDQYSPAQNTGLPAEKLREIGYKSIAFPPGFNISPKLNPNTEKIEAKIEYEDDKKGGKRLKLGDKKTLEKKAISFKLGSGVDWNSAEALAFGSLLLDGYPVRLSGQDVERGTFSSRHAVYHDQKTNETHTPLCHLSKDQGQFTVCNSSLSEYGVLGFELGFSLEHPDALVMWEAQFGDFVNGAQIILDQFLSSGEAKWMRQSGLVLLLPHGYEGQGPEHSSARLERFLQQVSDNPFEISKYATDKEPRETQKINWQVAYPSTPANYFHVLRRQLYRQFRKPLILMTPKSLLRHPDCISSFEEMDEGTKFQRVIGEVNKDIEKSGEKVRRLIFCTGKVFYDLQQHRDQNKHTDVAIARIEELAPFPHLAVAAEAKKFPKAEIVWVQEEPMNMGAFSFVYPRIETALKGDRDARPRYIGRAPSASTAAGTPTQHTKELKAFLTQAFAA